MNEPTLKDRKLYLTTEEEQRVIVFVMSKPFSEILGDITTYRDMSHLKTNKPINGISSYVWRQVRFITGLDPRLPMMSHLDLSYEIEKALNLICCYGLVRPFEKEILSHLEGQADEAIRVLNLDPHGAARAWKGLL